jgi:hypothetical protein
MRDHLGAAARARADEFSVQAIGAKYRALLLQILAESQPQWAQSPANVPA